jgi:hypothetical protein
MYISFVLVSINIIFYVAHTPLITFIVLDPNYKLAYVEDRWDTQDVVDGRAHLEALVSNSPNCSLSLLNMHL